jgi:hypothetical protein
MCTRDRGGGEEEEEGGARRVERRGRGGEGRLET